MELLDSDERAQVKGFLINKFRGAPELLTSGIRIVEEKIQRPCTGVVPFWRNLDLPEEDAVVWQRPRHRSDYDQVVTIGVVEVPCTSNFTDFDALASEPDVSLYRVADERDMVPDLLIFPGTKHTLQALDLIRERGMDRLAQRVLTRGGTIVGICGGYQILGRSIRDTARVESRRVQEKGLGLLDVETAFQARKTVRQVSAHHLQSGMEITGYEVHMGQTARGKGVQPFLEIHAGPESSAYPDGATAEEGRICGTYVHGLFDRPEFRRYFLNQLRVRHGWEPLDPSSMPNLDQRIDRWADFVESHINFSALTRLAGLSLG
jgi:adenosylcobyric acid synthase